MRHHPLEVADLDQGCSVPSYVKREIKKGITTRRCGDDDVNPFVISSFWNNPVDACVVKLLLVVDSLMFVVVVVVAHGVCNVAVSEAVSGASWT